MSGFGRLSEGARDWLATAREQSAAGRRHVAFEAARLASELAAKAILLEALGTFPKEHQVTGTLFAHGLVPESVEARDLARLLAEFTLGRYGFDRPTLGADVARAIGIAERMVAALGRP